MEVWTCGWAFVPIPYPCFHHSWIDHEPVEPKLNCVQWWSIRTLWRREFRRFTSLWVKQFLLIAVPNHQRLIQRLCPRVSDSRIRKNNVSAFQCYLFFLIKDVEIFQHFLFLVQFPASSDFAFILSKMGRSKLHTLFQMWSQQNAEWLEQDFKHFKTELRAQGWKESVTVDNSHRVHSCNQ